MGAEGRGVKMNRPVTQAKRMNRLNGSDVAYEDHTGTVSRCENTPM